MIGQPPTPPLFPTTPLSRSRTAALEPVLPHGRDAQRDQSAGHDRCRRTDRVARLEDRKSTRLNSSHSQISYAVFCLKKKNFRSSNTRHQIFHIHARLASSLS